MAIYVAESAAYADVAAAVALATTTGDIVTVPAGSETWNTQLVITKGITLRGAGIGSTVITRGVADNLIEITLTEDVPVRITGFTLDANAGAYANILINGKKNNSFCCSQVRIDHCYFERGFHSLYLTGWIEGVADNNVFHNCDIAVMVLGDCHYAWGREIAAGTEHAFFVEDNEFLVEDVSGLDEQIYHQDGGRSVVRYNTFDAESMTSYDALWYDTHGNQSYYTGTGDDIRGQPILEVYENIVKVHHTYRNFNIRGGSVLIWNNTLTTLSGGCPGINLQDEESWSSAFFDPLRTVWPAQDQIMNTFIWGNTANGEAIINATIAGENGATFIQKDRDYFMHAPESSGGYEYYTDRPGASDTEPTDGDGDGTMVFSESGANAYYPYTPYTYPHPLRRLHMGPVAMLFT